MAKKFGNKIHADHIARGTFRALRALRLDPVQEEIYGVASEMAVHKMLDLTYVFHDFHVKDDGYDVGVGGNKIEVKKIEFTKYPEGRVQQKHIADIEAGTRRPPDVFAVVMRMNGLESWELVGWESFGNFRRHAKLKTFASAPEYPMWCMPCSEMQLPEWFAISVKSFL